MTQQELKQSYSRQNWQTWFGDIFGSKVQFETQVENIEIDKDKIKSANRFASIKLADGKNLAVLDIETNADVQIARNRVGLRELVVKFIDHARYHGILAFYRSANTAEYRLSFISSEPKIDPETGNFSFEQTAPKRFTYLLGENAKTKTPADRLKIIADKHGNITLEDIKNAFSVETLTKEFYGELSNWYFWALQNVQFPQGDNEAAVIRLITRLMFVWFIKQKRLIPNEIFEKETLEKLLNYKDKTNSTYYKAILQNLFFATLNTEMGDKRKFVNRQSGIQGFFRYERFFTGKESFVDLMKNIPFLNGGLFENLDKNVGEENEIRIDCFSNRIDKEKLLKVPDFLFFSEEKQVDLNKIYDTKGKTYKVRGLIDILKTYNFTIEENTPTDVEVALDPELLGKVFENLLASYNPETQTTARKQTGSFYTPREIVDYMVNESLAACLQEKVGNDWGNNVQTVSVLNDIKILDPACGSGAFPMGVLQKMVQILQKLDPKNELWKQRQLALAEKIEDEQAREAAIENIEEAFENNELDYGRKLFLIENSIFGIDIQPIAVQIAKLRFFISLICEQTPNPEKPNLGIRPLPNLETKFVAANSLIGLEKLKQRTLGMDAIEPLEKELAEVRHKHFSARTPETKRKYREKDGELRNQIAKKLKEIGFNNDTAEKIASWNPYDQNTHTEWFDAEWMFGLTNGFDIVIGNPPYIRVQNIPYEMIDYYKRKYNTAWKRIDISLLFLEFGLSVLKQNGILCNIQSNQFITTEYGRLMRKQLINEGYLKQIVDFGDLPIFENILTYVSIFILSKYYKPIFNYQRIFELPFTKPKKFDIINITTLNDNIWTLGSLQITNIIGKIKQIKTVLSDYAKCWAGVITGNDDLLMFDIDNNAICIENELLMPVIRAQSCERYGYAQPTKKIFYPYKEVNDNTIVIEISEIKNKYPLSFDFIRKNEIELKNRKDSRRTFAEKNYWYGLVRFGKLSRFKKEKIVSPGEVKHNKFSLDLSGAAFSCARVFSITSESNRLDIKFLLGLLNSKLIEFYLHSVASLKSGGYYSYSSSIIDNIPIKISNNQQPIINLVEYMLYLKNNDNPDISDMVSNEIISNTIEKVIDACVYELYFEEEIKASNTNILSLLQETLFKITSLPIEQQIKQLYLELNEYKNEIRNRIILQEIHSESVSTIIKATDI
jgi:hypothetical protein